MSEHRIPHKDQTHQQRCLVRSEFREADLRWEAIPIVLQCFVPQIVIHWHPILETHHTLIIAHLPGHHTGYIPQHLLLYFIPLARQCLDMLSNHFQQKGGGTYV